MLEAYLALVRRHWSRDEESVLIAQSNISACLRDIGRLEEALVLFREIYARRLELWGISNKNTLISGLSLAVTLHDSGFLKEARVLSRDELLPVALRTLGGDDNITLAFRYNVAATLWGDENSRDDLRLNRHRITIPGYGVAHRSGLRRGVATRSGLRRGVATRF